MSSGTNSTGRTLLFLHRDTDTVGQTFRSYRGFLFAAAGPLAELNLYPEAASPTDGNSCHVSGTLTPSS